MDVSLKNFANLDVLSRSMRRRTLAVAAAQDQEVLETVSEAEKRGIADAVLVGNREVLRPMADRFGLSGAEIVDEADPAKAALIAAGLVREGRADVLMKGMVNSSDFLRAVLDRERGLRAGGLLSHLAAFEVPSYPKLMFHTDGGMNPSPDLAEKEQILENAVNALRKLGISRPKIAALAANEAVNSKIPASVDAGALRKMALEGRFGPCVLEGPVAMHVALSREAAQHKRIESEISGDCDLFLVPDIQAGNLIGKTMIYLAGAKMAGVILGARRPVVMTSRAENAEGKLNSILLACLIAGGEA